MLLEQLCLRLCGGGWGYRRMWHTFIAASLTRATTEPHSQCHGSQHDARHAACQSVREHASLASALLQLLTVLRSLVRVETWR